MVDDDDIELGNSSMAAAVEEDDEDGVLVQSSASATPAHTPPPKKRSIFSSASLSLTSSTSSSAAKPLKAQDVPPSMKLGFIVDHSSEKPIPMDTPLISLIHSRLRLCHITEWLVAQQVMAIRSELVQSDSYLSMFNRAKYKHKAPFVKFEGDVPFNPRRMLRFTPTLSLRATQWKYSKRILEVEKTTLQCLLSTRRVPLASVSLQCLKITLSVHML